MAQTKKKAPVTKKTAAVKITAKSKQPAKARVTKKQATPQSYKTLRRSTSENPFFSVKFTNQTIYWLILGGVVLVLGSWIVNLQVTVNGIYDKIDENQLYYDQIEDINNRVLENRKAIEQKAQ